MTRKITHKTYTSQVYEELRASDDFMTLPQLCERLHITSTRASAALHSLFKYHAVDCLSSDGSLWWYATPNEDRRIRVVDEQVDGVTRNRKCKPRTRRGVNELPKRD